MENKICKSTDCLKAALSSAVTSLQVMVASARSVNRVSNVAVTLLYLVPWPSWPTYTVKTQDSKHYVCHHWPVSPVTQQLGLCFLYCFSGLSALLLVTYIVACKSEVVMNWTVWSIIHILGFITPDFLHICVMIIAGLLKFQALIWMGVSIGKCLTSIQIRHLVRLFEL